MSRTSAHHVSAPVLVVDDDPDVQDVLRCALERAGHDVVCADGQRSAMRAFFAHRPSLVLLDVVLGAGDGWAVLEQMRELCDEVPIMVVTSCAGDLEKVRAFREGADDHIVKPFSVMEIVARAGALLRRTRGAAPIPEVFDDGCIRIDPQRAAVVAAGAHVRLTPLEFRLMATLAEHSGKVLSCGQLLELAWHDDGSGGRSDDEVRVYIGYLRRKLRAAFGGVAPIETVRGFGYRYEPVGAVAMTG